MNKRKRVTLLDSEIELVWKSPGFRSLSLRPMGSEDIQAVGWRHFWLGRKVQFEGGLKISCFLRPDRFGSRLSIRARRGKKEQVLEVADPTATRMLFVGMGLLCTIFFFLDPVYLINSEFLWHPTSLVASTVWLTVSLRMALGLQASLVQYIALFVAILIGYSRLLWFLWVSSGTVAESVCVLCPFFLAIPVFISLDLHSFVSDLSNEE